MLTMRLDALYNSYSLNGQVVDCFPDPHLCYIVPLEKREVSSTQELGVQLTAAGNSAVKVVVTNNGDMALNLLRRATLFDEKLPVERISMFASNSCKFYLDLPNPTRLETNYY